MLEGTIYTYGSRVGPAAPDLLGACVFAWPFAAFDAASRVVASASGLAPAWATSVYTAELWAVLQAASVPSLDDPIIRTDCFSVVWAYAAGCATQCQSTSPHASVWRDLQATLGERGMNLAWMPAHTAEHHIGEAVLSNGELLTEADRDGNALADELTKARGESRRSPS